VIHLTCSIPTSAAMHIHRQLLLLLLLLTACMPARSPEPFQAEQQLNGLTIGLETNARPSMNGTEQFTVTLRDDQGRPVTADEVYLDFTMPAMPMGTNRPIAEPEAAGRYRATTVYTMEGEWAITVVARVNGVEQRATFTIMVLPAP